MEAQHNSLSNPATDPLLGLPVPHLDIDRTSELAELLLTPVPFVEVLGLSTGIAATLALGIGGYYAHELFDPELGTPLAKPAQPHPLAITEAQKQLPTFQSTVPMLPENMAAPEFLETLLHREVQYWHDDWQAFLRSLRGEAPSQAPVTTPSRSLAESADPEGKQRIYDGFERAMQRDFHGAIRALQAISPTSPYYQLAKKKISEYSQKQDVRARVSLQAAYDAAAKGDFQAAIAELREIPGDSTLHYLAKRKLAEYDAKHNVQAETWLYRAKKMAEQGEYKAALLQLRAIPPESAIATTVKTHILEYSRKLALINVARLTAVNAANAANETPPATALSNTLTEKLSTKLPTPRRLPQKLAIAQQINQAILDTAAQP